jgi:hypothetical protein
VTPAPSGSAASTSATAVVFSSTLTLLPVVKAGASSTLVTVTVSDCTTLLVPSVAVT